MAQKKLGIFKSEDQNVWVCIVGWHVVWCVVFHTCTDSFGSSRGHEGKYFPVGTCENDAISTETPNNNEYFF